MKMLGQECHPRCCYQNLLVSFISQTLKSSTSFSSFKKNYLRKFNGTHEMQMALQLSCQYHLGQRTITSTSFNADNWEIIWLCKQYFKWNLQANSMQSKSIFKNKILERRKKLIINRYRYNIWWKKSDWHTKAKTLVGGRTTLSRLPYFPNMPARSPSLDV